MDNDRNNKLVFRLILIVLIGASLLMMAGGWIRMAGIPDPVKNDVKKMMVDVERACTIRPDSVTDKIPHLQVLVKLVQSLDDMALGPAGGTKVAAAIVKDRQVPVSGKIVAMEYIILILLSLVFGIVLLYVLIRKKKIPRFTVIFAICQVLLLILVLLLCLFLNSHKDDFLTLLSAGGLFSPGEYGLDASIDFRPTAFTFLTPVTAVAAWALVWLLRRERPYKRADWRAGEWVMEPRTQVSFRESGEAPDIQRSAPDAALFMESGETQNIQRPAPAAAPVPDPIQTPEPREIPKAPDRAPDTPQILELSETEALFGTSKLITTPEGGRLKIRVPEGMKTGNIIRLKGYGKMDSLTGERSDLQLEIKVRKPSDNVVIR